MSREDPTEKQRAAWAAAERHSRLIRERREYIEAQERAAREAATRHAAQFFDAAIRTANDERVAAEAALLAETEALGAAAKRSIPLGTALREWEVPRYERKGKRYTGRTGVLVLITAELKAGALTRRYHGDVGEAAVQVNRKDGKPGKVYVTGWDVANRWEPIPAEVAS